VPTSPVSAAPGSSLKGRQFQCLPAHEATCMTLATSHNSTSSKSKTAKLRELVRTSASVPLFRCRANASQAQISRLASAFWAELHADGIQAELVRHREHGSPTAKGIHDGARLRV
jgi:hypothetical protein